MKWIDKATGVEYDVIPKDELIDGAYYEGTCRNASMAQWNAKKNKFVYTRYKFGLSFDDEIEHPEDEVFRLSINEVELNPYDVFIPFRILDDRQPEE